MDGDIVLRLLELAEPGTSFKDVGGRRILRDAADEILAARACAEMMLQGTGQKICESMAMRVLYRQWIPVEERMPEDGESVLWFNRSWSCPLVVAKRDGESLDWGGDLCGTMDGFTHWMPLPELPAELRS